jgi:TRAP-type uncharacterized transport system fused permease subunit
MFIFNNGMLLQGAWDKVVIDVTLGVALVFVAGLAAHGYVIRLRLPVIVRLVLAGLALAIMWPAAEVQRGAAVAAIVLYLGLYAWARRGLAARPS